MPQEHKMRQLGCKGADITFYLVILKRIFCVKTLLITSRPGGVILEMAMSIIILSPRARNVEVFKGFPCISSLPLTGLHNCRCRSHRCHNKIKRQNKWNAPSVCIYITHVCLWGTVGTERRISIFGRGKYWTLIRISEPYACQDEMNEYALLHMNMNFTVHSIILFFDQPPQLPILCQPLFWTIYPFLIYVSLHYTEMKSKIKEPTSGFHEKRKLFITDTPISHSVLKFWKNLKIASSNKKNQTHNAPVCTYRHHTWRVGETCLT